MTVADAVAALGRGEPVLVYDSDDREGEVDMVYAAAAVDPGAVARLRNEAGGLICVALPATVCDVLGFPFLTDVLDDGKVSDDVAYGDRPAFSYWVNHVDTETGVTDADRAQTITALADAAQAVADGADVDAAQEFRVPGHVPALRAHRDGLAGRQGHTELSLALVKRTALPPAAVVCEMLDDDTGGALSVADARAYADEEGLVLVDGAAVREATTEDPNI